ncbi:probable glutathione S-transferase [Amborella trichopoda]|uniref:glutathione transferase n=1 Tax=Amborella trichopoda TaxID=13333 RepID=W1PSI4_AMBTC|nr:probable glutathione S-transferase [Amborella trichopoda]XP_020525892.1 probable glutathione S-transferase [Amborella trichopoda]ERN10804.1 hypothetical protein AMTR_s00027p00230090 [Amborella trichopoda]|eukprot:XP_006849223.1 probable glutathione S-transferase [Amborella trichopoda]
MAKKEHKVRLLGTWRSRFVHRVRLALKLKGIEYEYIEEDLKNKSPLLLESNPVYKKVPVLIHGNNVVSESMVILEYIDETWSENPLMPQDPYDRAITRFWSKFIDDKCLAPIRTVLLTDGEEQEKAMKEAKEALKTLERGLKGKFFGGEVIGFVDIAASCLSIWSEVLGEVIGTKFIDSEKLPHLHSWIEEFTSIDLVKESFPPYDKLFASYKALREDHLAAKFSQN